MSEEQEVAPTITLDGPSGSGKGTISQLLAEKLGWHYLDSGALYRVLALAAQTHGLALDDEAALTTLAEHLDVEFIGGEILLEGESVGESIRGEDCGEAASLVAAIPSVREALLARQRAFRRAPGLIADGRDMGTTVFPSAGLKVFLTASPEERAQRRYKQLKQKGNDVNLPTLLDEIARRDARDGQRGVSPMKPAPEAVVLDTTELDIPQVVERVMRLYTEKCPPTA